MVDIDVTPQIRRAFEGLFRDIKRHAIRVAQREAALQVSNGPITNIQGIPVDPTPPTTGQVLTYDGTKWTPT
jgi:hypothetical protein